MVQVHSQPCSKAPSSVVASSGPRSFCRFCRCSIRTVACFIVSPSPLTKQTNKMNEQTTVCLSPAPNLPKQPTKRPCAFPCPNLPKRPTKRPTKRPYAFPCPNLPNDRVHDQTRPKLTPNSPRSEITSFERGDKAGFIDGQAGGGGERPGPVDESVHV